MNKVLNKKTGRYVNENGTIGKIIKKQILSDLQTTCNNMSDPISLDDFSDIGINSLQKIIYIGEGPKKNAYLLENIYQVYKNAVLENKLPTDPMNRSYTFSYEEIESINDMMRLYNKDYKPPVYIDANSNYELDINFSIRYPNYFHVIIKQDNIKIYDLGLIPAWYEPYETGSTDNTSAVLISNIRHLWDVGKLQNEDVRLLLGHSIGYWRTYRTQKVRFLELCEDIRNKI